MPTLIHAAPRYRRRKGRKKPDGSRQPDQAIVTISGRDHWLGRYGTKASKAEYDRLIGEWLAAGRPSTEAAQHDLSMNELMVAYLKWGKRHYGKSSELTCIKAVIRRIRQLYGKTEAIEFGPLALKAVRQGMIDDGMARSTINMNVGRIKRMFRWAASEELIPVSTYQALATVSGLQKNRSAAKETKPVLPVDDKTVDATLPFLPKVPADMVRLQRLTGARPAEICIVRPMDIDRSGDVWAYVPESHKTEHHGRHRVIFIGPKAQAILLPYLLRDAKGYCFSPIESERKRREERHTQRTTPLSCGNKPGSRKQRGKKAKRPAGERYDSNSYRRAIHRACDKAFPPATKLTGDALRQWQADHRWSPNQLRHSAATSIRRHGGLEAAQVVLGHAAADITQVYAERDLELARKIMGEVG